MTTIEWAKRRRGKAKKEMDKAYGTEKYESLRSVWQHWNIVIAALARLERE